MYDVFISYRRKLGFAVAKMISELLKAKGMRVFVDLDELRSGTFDDKILQAIEKTPAFLLILTPGSLDRCSEEGDWLAKEISAAVETGRNIIPVLCEGFSWPKGYVNGDDQITLLSHYNSVVMSYEYVDAMVDKIIAYTKGESFAVANDDEAAAADAPKDDIDGFFAKKMKRLDSVEGVDFAFHAGSAWHQDIKRLDTLAKPADTGKRIRVLVNSEPVADATSQFMRHRLKRYLSFEEAIALWRNFEAMYENAEVRVCEIPLFRIYYSFHMNDPAENATRIKFYTHGNADITANFCRDFTAAEDGYQLFKNEFEFLWERSADSSTKR